MFGVFLQRSAFYSSAERVTQNVKHCFQWLIPALFLLYVAVSHTDSVFHSMWRRRWAKWVECKCDAWKNVLFVGQLPSSAVVLVFLSFLFHLLLLQSMVDMGNSRARQLYEAHLPESFRRPQTDQYPPPTSFSTYFLKNTSCHNTAAHLSLLSHFTCRESAAFILHWWTVFSTIHGAPPYKSHRSKYILI